jgi:hypothetical protein
MERDAISNQAARPMSGHLGVAIESIMQQMADVISS